ncbi:MAG TPA: DEAD/DEAH box helicase [Calditrichia bacterium]|nr:DEAD/DEAH box helicase [Calditrichia bacterium]
MNLEQLIQFLRNDSQFMAQVTHWETIAERPAVSAPFPEKLDRRLTSALEKRDIRALYAHQAEAFNRVQAGENIVLVTPTASGKTFGYNLPVLNTILENPDARALYLFPTKALSQDQYQELHELISVAEADIKTYTFDGDTPASARQAIRRAGHVVITNPDMLHQGILPHHTTWLKLFENLHYVVIDELHHYRGVFGSHLANVIRRLKRIAAFYNSHPRFICCSATIANPGELASRILGEPVSVIDKNGAPAGRKHFILYNPPIVNAELGIRRSVINEVSRLGLRFLETRNQSIIFARSRIRVEVLLRYMREHARHLKIDLKKVRGYRGGYLPNERREIEKGLRSGEILNVVSTNALELGIDIGQLDVALLAGYPGSIASAWQQAGRAGRRNTTSVVILVASSTPQDQFLVNNPGYFFGKSPEHGIVDPDNLQILLSHIKCAAFELPFNDGESFSESGTGEILDYLDENGVLRHTGGRYHWMSEIYPAETVNLRVSSPDNVVIIDTTGPEKVIGEVDLFSAPTMVYQEAIYMHGDRQYHVDKLDWERKKAYVRQVSVDYFTDAITKADIKVLAVDETRELPGLEASFGELNVNWVTTGYKKIKLFTNENVGSGQVVLDELEMPTAGTWLAFDDDLAEQLEISPSDLSGVLRGVANLLHNIAPVFLMCDPSDLRAVSMVRAPFSQRPTIYLYDNFPGGIGLSYKFYHDPVPAIRGALQRLNQCVCESGCPSCVGTDLEIGGGNKWRAGKLLERIASVF